MASLLTSLLGGNALDGAAKLVNAIKGKNPADADKLAQITADIQSLQLKYKAEFDEHNAEMEKLQEQDDAASRHDQVAVDEIEAGAKGDGTLWGNIVAAFQSCWRPAIGWTCAIGYFQQMVVCPWGTFIAALAGKKVVFPTLDIATLTTVLLAMLGLGAYRSYDKNKGTSK